MSDVMITKITRGETYPKLFEVFAPNTKGYISITTHDWTAQMFYELPAIRICIYDTNKQIKEQFVKTYCPTFPLDIPCEIIVPFTDLPDTFTIAIIPVFDNNAITARNNLILSGEEKGDLWEDETEEFSITISFTANNKT